MKTRLRLFLMALVLLALNVFVFYRFYDVGDRIRFALKFSQVHVGMRQAQAESLVGDAGGMGGGSRQHPWMLAFYQFGDILFSNHIVGTVRPHYLHDSWRDPHGPYDWLMFALVAGSILMVVIFLRRSSQERAGNTANAWGLGTIPIFVALLMLTACSRLTEDNLQKIHNGMTTDDVKAILGEPTSSQTGSALGIISGTTYVYHVGTSDVKITFVNDKVIATEGEFK